MEQRSRTFGEYIIEKFNPYHDRLGRFSSASGAVSFTYSPGKSKAHDMAIAREKERSKYMSGIGESAGKASEMIYTGERDLQYTKVGASFEKLPRYLQTSINSNLKISANMKDDILNGRKSKMTDEWTTGTKQKKIKIITDVKSDKLEYTVKRGNKILVRTGSKERVANKVAAFYLENMK